MLFGEVESLKLALLAKVKAKVNVKKLKLRNIKKELSKSELVTHAEVVRSLGTSCVFLIGILLLN